MTEAAVHISSTMTTATSMTMNSTPMNSTINPSASGSATMTKEERMEDAIQKMRSNISRYGRANDRRMVLRSLRDVKFLSCLQLDPVQPVSGPLSELENEVAEETIVLNGIPFKASGKNSDGSARITAPDGKSSNFLGMLKSLCSKFCEMKGVKVDPNELYEKLIVRMAKTTSSADAYFRLNSLLGSSDLLVMPLPSTPSSGANIPSKALSHTLSKEAPTVAPPIELNLYVAHGEIHITLSATYEFGMFRKTDVKPARPWITIQALVTERTNFSNDQSVRHLNVKLPDLY